MALAKERKNVAQAARELEISASLLRTWIAVAETAEARGKGLAGALEEKQETERLRKLVAEQAEELAIIKKGLYSHSCGRNLRPPQWKSMATLKLAKFRNPRAPALISWILELRPSATAFVIRC